MQNGLKRKASCLDYLASPHQQQQQRDVLDENTQERAEIVILSVKSAYAKQVEELAEAYEKILKKTKETHWSQLVKLLGNGVLNSLEIDYNSFFVTTTTAVNSKNNSFSLLSHDYSSSNHNNHATRKNNKTWVVGSSGDEADIEEEQDLEVFSQLVLKELKTNKNGVVKRLIPGTQFTTPGGTTACTAISFAAAYRMSMINKIETLEHAVNWDRVLVLGTEIWSIWKKDTTNKHNGRYLISVEDIRNMDFLKRVFGKVWETLNKTETEKVGYINDEINLGLGGEKEGVVNLRDALASMIPCNDKPKTAVAVICGGAYGATNSSLSIWKNQANQFALYNSHGDQKSENSFLYLMRDLDAATHCIRSILSYMPQTTLDRCIAGQTSCVLYSMQILRFEFTNVDLAYS